MVTVCIPSRNEPYLQKTIQDLLIKSTGKIEIIVVLDGYWTKPEEIVNDKRVIYIHTSEPKGMRSAINSAVAVAQGEYILKTDAHCMFSQGYDEVLARDCAYDWVVVPRRYALDVKNWKIEERTDNKYPIDYYYLDNELHGREWREKNNDVKLKDKKIDETMSNQGSCWFMRKTYFKWLDLMDESLYGMFWNEFQEIGLKCWLSGGKVMVNKNAWYSHWHKTESRGYNLPSQEQINAQKNVARWLKEKMFKKQKYNIRWLVDKFNPPV